MHLDFSLILVVATLVTGLVWLLDKLVFKKRRARSRFQDKKPGLVVEYSNSFFPVLALVLILRSFLFEPFQIPSGSMLPPLKIGDFILVNKFSYGVRLPVIHTRIIPVNDPKPGDVAVFRYPLDERLNYIKRVIGVAGDKISYENSHLHINGQPVGRQLIEKNPVESPKEELWKEKLGEVNYSVYNYPTPTYNFPEITVPEGYYFVMGDNRDHSNDSRFWCQAQPHNETGCLIIPGYANDRGAPLVMGFVAEENLVGRAFAVWMHWPKLLSLPKFSAIRTIE